MPTDEPWEDRSWPKGWMDRTGIRRGAEHHRGLCNLPQAELQMQLTLI